MGKYLPKVSESIMRFLSVWIKEVNVVESG